MSLLKAAVLLLIPGAPNSGSLANSGSKGCIFTGKWLGCFNLIENNPETGKKSKHTGWWKWPLFYCSFTLKAVRAGLAVQVFKGECSDLDIKFQGKLSHPLILRSYQGGI